MTPSPSPTSPLWLTWLSLQSASALMVGGSTMKLQFWKVEQNPGHSGKPQSSQVTALNSVLKSTVCVCSSCVVIVAAVVVVVVVVLVSVHTIWGHRGFLRTVHCVQRDQQLMYRMGARVILRTVQSWNMATKVANTQEAPIRHDICQHFYATNAMIWGGNTYMQKRVHCDKS